MNPTHDQLTAYALGEGTTAEREALAGYLANHPDAAAEVAAVMDTAALLSREFATESSAPGLDPQRRAALAALPIPMRMPSASTATPAAKRLRFPHAIVWPGLLAAGLAVVVMQSPETPAPVDMQSLANKEADAKPLIADERKAKTRLLSKDDSRHELQADAVSSVASAKPASAKPASAAPASAPKPVSVMAPPLVATGFSSQVDMGAPAESVSALESVAESESHSVIVATRSLEDMEAVATSRKISDISTRRFSDVKEADKKIDYGRSGLATGIVAGNVANDVVAPGEAYPEFAAAGWHRVSTAADDANRWSTLGANVDTASYANVRRFLSNGQLPPADAVRTEELLNSFRYSYQPPTNRSVPFAVLPEVGAAPWAPEHRLVRIALKGYELDPSTRPPANLVFLVDVSGSMNQPTKLPLVQRALTLLAQQLRADDRVAIVTYAGDAGVRLEPTSVENLPRIKAAIDGLSAGGSTNGAGGIRMAYQLAKRDFIKGGVNRVVLCTDGDFNVGVSSRDDLEKLIATEARSNVFLTALGFGMGNYHDTTLQVLADKGNGNYGYIDSEAEARKQIVDGGTGMLMTIAKDVKLQVEFNPALVGAWRLLGYEKRHLEHQDFTNDKKDGGEIGAGHAMTALYEIVTTNRASGALPIPKYAPEAATSLAAAKAESTGELLTINLRWKLPEGTTSTAIAIPVSDRATEPSTDFRFAAGVAEFAQSLRGVEGTWSLDRALRTIQETSGEDPSRRELIDLIRKTQQLRQ